MAQFLKVEVVEHTVFYLKLGSIDVTSIENIKPSKAIEIGIETKRIKYFMETQQNHRNRTN